MCLSVCMCVYVYVFKKGLNNHKCYKRHYLIINNLIFIFLLEIFNL